MVNLLKKIVAVLDEVKQVAETLRKEYLQELGSMTCNCQYAAEELTQKLVDLGYDAFVVEGQFEIDIPLEDEWDPLAPDHYWVELDGEIIDFTADQFNSSLETDKMPAVVYGTYTEYPRYIGRS